MMAWLMKVKLIAWLQQITDLSSFIWLFLEGDTLDLYMEMSERD